MGVSINIAKDISEAETKALDSLSRYKFLMFGYWAGIWVHLNRIDGSKRVSPFSKLVELARAMQDIMNPLDRLDEKA